MIGDQIGVVADDGILDCFRDGSCKREIQKRYIVTAIF
jgi:hypothetical protein